MVLSLTPFYFYLLDKNNIPYYIIIYELFVSVLQNLKHKALVGTS